MSIDQAIRGYIRTIPNFPHQGIMFRDVTTLFADPEGLRLTIKHLSEPYMNAKIDKVVGLEARGFILGGAVAEKLGVGFIPARKAGKLPSATVQQSYKLEYGEAVLELHEDALQAGERVLLIDDLLATGGTAEAGVKLVERLGAVVTHTAFIIDLPALGGNALLQNMGLPVQVLCSFDGL